MLFNYDDEYSRAYPRSADIFGTSSTTPAKNLALPLQWNSNGTQTVSAIGPKRSPADDLPGTEGIARSFISTVRFLPAC